MREITRIHIAKIAYDIEIDAKKDLENYIKALERYANDQEILDDIEIRITELLTEQGVASGGVITQADVDAVRARLGEPSDFASEDMGEDQIDTQRRRIYRDEDEAVIGGVLAGLARSFGTDPLWLRLLFIVVLFASFGTALIVYLILWLIIPPAQTAAEKLRMSGRSVTLASIKELAGNDEQRSKRAQTIRRIVSIFTGSFLVIAGIAGLIMIIGVLYQLKFGRLSMVFTSITDKWIYESWWFMAMLVLCVISGILFSTLCFILASAAFRRRWTKRIGIAVVAISIAGLVTFGSGVGAWVYGNATMEARISELRKIVTTDLPTSFMNVKTLTVVDNTEIDGDITYNVTDKPYFTLDAYPGIKADIKLSEDGKSIVVGLSGDLNRLNSVMAPSLTVYGPALDAINLEGDYATVTYYNEAEQEQLSVDAEGSVSRAHISGTYARVQVAGDAYSKVSLDNAAISDLSVDGGGVRAGGIRNLNVTQPDVCPAHEGYMGSYSIAVRGISSGKLTYNGVEHPAETISNSCGKVIVDNEYTEWFD